MRVADKAVCAMRVWERQEVQVLLPQTNEMSDQLKPTSVSEIVERACIGAPYMRKAITRACEEAVQSFLCATDFTAMADQQLRQQIQELRAQIESLANDRNHCPVTRLEMGGDLVTALPEETLLGSKHCPDTENELGDCSVAFTHVEHYFPKGYNPDEEPWKSISAHCQRLRQQLNANKTN